MKVMLSPGAEELGAFAGEIAGRLAGAEGEVFSLRGLRRAAFRRRLTSGEVQMLRQALLGIDSPAAWKPDSEIRSVIGYVCVGKRGVSVDNVGAVAVADHVNLTWRSPLTGPNDDRFGPRFPVVAGVYRPDLVEARLCGPAGFALRQGVAAGVRDMRRLSSFEKEMIQRWGMGAVTSELVPVALLAAHAGLRLAAVVVIAEWDEVKE